MKNWVALGQGVNVFLFSTEVVQAWQESNGL
jgi:hypothetical protein